MLSKVELESQIRRNPEAVLIVNAASRRGERSFRAARVGLERRGIRIVASYPIHEPAQLPKAVEGAIRNGHRLIVVGGGDGTLSSAVGAFAYADAVLGILPLGTGNSFAQTLTIPLRLERALDVIASGKVADVDLGVVNEAYFSNVATIGLSADVARRTPTWAKRIAGPLSYLVTGAAVTYAHEAFQASVRTDSQRYTIETHQIIVANGRIFGASAVLPYAHVDNRSLAIVGLRGKTRWGVARLWLALLSGLMDQLRDASGFMQAECTIETTPEQFVDVDGEIITKTPAHFSLAAEALRVMVPASFEEPWD